MRRIGVIGGLGPQATMDFEQRLHRVAASLLPRQAGTGYPPLVVWYVREAPMALGPDGRPVEPARPSAALLEAARGLGMVSDFLVITSNTPHMFAEAVATAGGVPVLSLIELTIDAVAEAAPRLVGVLGAASAEPYYHALYERGLAARGIATLGIPATLAVPLDAAIFSVMENADPASLRGAAQAAVEWLRGAGADVIVLGCTEIPLLLGETETPDLINPAELLARAAVELAIAD